jgi:hypothetical protein
MLYAAIDIHKRMFQAAVLDVETGETVERRFGATGEELGDWAMQLQGRLAAVAIEATTGWRWVWRELSALGSTSAWLIPHRRRRCVAARGERTMECVHDQHSIRTERRRQLRNQ